MLPALLAISPEAIVVEQDLRQVANAGAFDDLRRRPAWCFACCR